MLDDTDKQIQQERTEMITEKMLADSVNMVSAHT